MKCPKCGYNSFDYLDSCKKCGKDLVEFKQNYGIKSVLFPGQMSPGGVAEETEFDSATADAAVSAATGVTAAAVTSTAATEPAGDGADGDDFGFDFMGDSAEDDDLSFDELFEEAPEDEDIEETIEAPKEAAAHEAESSADFSFDLPDEDAELEDDFGFDPEDEVNDSVAEDDFSFDDAEPDSVNESDDSGSEEDPNRPFDLPESPQSVGAPEDNPNPFEESHFVPVPVEKPADLFVEDADFSIAEDVSESYIFEPEESVPSASSLEEQPEVLTAELETIAATTVPLVAAVTATASVVSSVVTESLPEEAIEDGAVPSPSLGNCIGAFVFDFALLAIVGISFVVAAEAAISTGETRLLPSLETLIDLSVPYFLVLFFLAFGYFTLFHFLAGQTPGKMLAGLRVETTEGEPLTFAQAFLRSVGGLLQLLPAGLGYLVVLSNPERRGWNDRLAGTRVVALRDAP
ncbi:MAG: RDD family protein [Desulfuromusa sp.]|jgi:uncharacterized RDD family membrane protein YckC|nr:RDD family protein [Desulfuromusa sp.]